MSVSSKEVFLEDLDYTWIRPQGLRLNEHAELCIELNTLYEKKNADYGDSFHKTFQEEGWAMPRIRLRDKFERVCNLSRKGKQEVSSESLRDTLIDLANYALMSVMELDRETEKKEDADALSTDSQRS